MISIKTKRAFIRIALRIMFLRNSALKLKVFLEILKKNRVSLIRTRGLNATKNNLCMASDPLYAEDEMELTSSEINLPHNLDEIPSPKESTIRPICHAIIKGKSVCKLCDLR